MCLKNSAMVLRLRYPARLACTYTIRIGMPQDCPAAGISHCFETGSADPHRRSFESNGQERMIEATACGIAIIRVALPMVANARGAKCAMVMRPFLSLSGPFGPPKSSSKHCGSNRIPEIGQSGIFSGVTKLPHRIQLSQFSLSSGCVGLTSEHRRIGPVLKMCVARPVIGGE